MRKSVKMKFIVVYVLVGCSLFCLIKGRRNPVANDVGEHVAAEAILSQKGKINAMYVFSF